MKKHKPKTKARRSNNANTVLNAVHLGGLLKWIRDNFNMKYNGWTPQRGEVGEINPFYTDKQLIKKYNDRSRRKK